MKTIFKITYICLIAIIMSSIFGCQQARYVQFQPQYNQNFNKERYIWQNWQFGTNKVESIK